MNNRVGLCVVFNHNFEANIPKLRKIYDNRFHEVLYLIPSFRSSEADIKTVYRGSYNFHGYISDKLEDILRMDVDYYMFVHDDVILNPNINQVSLLEKIGLGEKDAFFPYIRGYNPTQNWYWNERVISRLIGIEKHLFSSGFIDFFKYLPEKELAISQFEKHKIPAITSINKQEIFDTHKNNFNETNNLIWQFIFADSKEELQLPYPLALGISDIFVIRRSCMEYFGHICGIFAAMDIFVEAAIPTALLLACQEIQFIKNTQLRAHNYLKPWSIKTPEEQELNEIINNLEKVDDLHKVFVDDHIFFIHPIKLSKLM
ncbi:MAG: hypothetical protein SWX82_32015 [Cyanobacteriota bacterium]|nr:hypothetical protein [Cyanobacteriota bacterium]